METDPRDLLLAVPRRRTPEVAASKETGWAEPGPILWDIKAKISADIKARNKGLRVWHLPEA